MRTKLWYYKLKGCLLRVASKNISRHSFIARNVQILGIKHVVVGKHCVIGENTTFTVNDRSSKTISLIIGDNTYIGRNNFFTVGKSIEIGEYCVFGNNCSFLCSDHIFTTPLTPYRLSGATNDKKIKIGVNCWLGINVSVVGNVSIGHGSIIGANTVVTKDIPSFCMAVGSPSRIIKRFDFEKGLWITDGEIKDNIYNDESIYLEYFRKNFETLPKSYHASSAQFKDI
jgi:acetyltransferase-like isoleucine patch superfamily enzyme